MSQGAKRTKNQPKIDQSSGQAAAAETEFNPEEYLQIELNGLDFDRMSRILIESLCKATHATQYRPLFREVAQHEGELGVYHALQVMIRSTDRVRHNQICMAATQAIASARTGGKGLFTDSVNIQPAISMANKVAQAARRGCGIQDVSHVASLTE